MTEKKKIDENQIWLMTMVIIPLIVSINLGTVLTNDSNYSILYSGLFGGISGLIGFGAFYLTKNSSRLIKGVTTIAIFSAGVSLAILIQQKPTEKQLLEQQWITQKIGTIEFDSPSKLELKSNKIPDGVKSFYSELKLYTDEEKDRTTSFINSKINADSVVIENSFIGALNGMLQNLDVDINDVQFEVFTNDAEEFSAMFSFELNGKTVHGYGFMYHSNDELDSIWLMPLSNGFSVDYIKSFDSSVLPDYDS